MAAVPSVHYRQSYVEKDRCVRNSTAVQVPGVDIMQGYLLSKSEFESVSLQTTENMDSTQNNVPNADNPAASKSQPPSAFARHRKNAHSHDRAALAESNRGTAASPVHSPLSPSKSSSTSRYLKEAPAPPQEPQRPFRAPIEKPPEPKLTTSADAADYADVCRKHAASLQRSMPPDYDGAGEFFEKACDARAKYGLFCSPDNADAHVEYAQNLSKRGLTPEAEYHLRCAADVYRMLNARMARKYGDVLLYLAVVIDRQGRLQEAENFYRSALAVYRANKLSDDNVRVAIDSFSNNLRAQDRGEEVNGVVRRHFLGALD